MPDWLSRRAADALRDSREAFDWLAEDATTLEADGRALRWWTFGGTLANAAIARSLRCHDWTVSSDALCLKLTGAGEDVLEIKRALLESLTEEGSAPIASDSLDDLKFGKCVPDSHVLRMAKARFATAATRRRLASMPLSTVRGQ